MTSTGRDRSSSTALGCSLSAMRRRMGTRTLAEFQGKSGRKYRLAPLGLEHRAAAFLFQERPELRLCEPGQLRVERAALRLLLHLQIEVSAVLLSDGRGIERLLG